MKNKNAVITLSVGPPRIWAKTVSKLTQDYADRIGADFFYIDKIKTEVDSILEMPEKPGRRFKYPYALKAYVVWKYLKKYERILVIDDTCCISKLAPNIFDHVPLGCVGHPWEPENHAEVSFKTIREYLPESDWKKLKFDPSLYMNSGVLVFDRSHRDIFSPENILKAKDLLYSKYPHQTLAYYLLRKHKAKMHLLPSNWHVIPGFGQIGSAARKELRKPDKYMRDDIYIYHVTGLYNHRDELIQNLVKKL
jgi:hypothetical protein